MKALIICPIERPAFKLLPESESLVNLPLFGTTLLCLWLEHLARLGARHVRILAGVQPERIKASVGDGSAWGLSLEIVARSRELGIKEARLVYRTGKAADWLKPPHDIVLADSLPGRSQHPLFNSYAEFFSALKGALPFAAERGRIGVHQIQPGIWAGLHTRIAPTAKLTAPVWLGEHVRIGRFASVGPNAFIEDRVLVGASAEVRESFVGPDTAVGAATQLIESLALGSTLANWRRNCLTEVADPFLLCALRQPPISWQLGKLLGKLILRRRPSPRPRALPAPVSVDEKPVPLTRSAAQ